ncbi:MAG TPA: hypothetical protein PLP93_11415 [Nitrosomonas sp.]|nr:hypothetical protein [Nitrosomonas sp.]HRB33741.1 hypothetical protein [Nitrosomonas sp.]HRB46713.1 hypothetical protein [Nitrosomonas sp.]
MFLYKDISGISYSVFFFILLLTILIINSKELQASECFLKLQNKKSSGTTVFNNNCRKESELSLNALLEIKEDTRLWLESKVIHNNTENYWLICQNRASAPIRIVVNSEILPWITPDSTSKCNRLANRMECFDTSTERETLFCATGKITKKPPEIERTTSVTVRSETNKPSPNHNHHDINTLKTFFEPRINLCRNIFPNSNSIELTLSIKASGEITDVIVKKESGIQRQLEDCVTEVIKDSILSVSEKDTLASISFE